MHLLINFRGMQRICEGRACNLELSVDIFVLLNFRARCETLGCNIFLLWSHSLYILTHGPNVTLHRIKIFLVISSLHWDLIVHNTGIKDLIVDLLGILEVLLFHLLMNYFILNLSTTSHFTYEFATITIFRLNIAFLVVDDIINLTVFRINDLF